MNSKQRMITAMKNGKPDRVPAAPDMSNMIPCRLTGRPFWDIYLFKKYPKWKAYIDAVKYFGFDGWLDGAPAKFPFQIEEEAKGPQWKEAIIKRTDDRIYTRMHAVIDGKETWKNVCNVYYIDNPPMHNVPLVNLHMSEDAPATWEDVEPEIKEDNTECFREAYEYMGDKGAVGLSVWMPGLEIKYAESIYEYYDNPEKVKENCRKEHEYIVRLAKEMLKLKPDFILFGASGHMLGNPVPIFRELSLPTLKEVTKLCKEADIPSQVHCCGPEYELVKIAAEETDLSNINPLELPPMGNCTLAQVKKEFGKKISLMGNLHTTDIMLKGTPSDVERAAKQAIEDAGEGGGFILSTGDQCGRDTPDENIYALIEAAKKYGGY